MSALTLSTVVDILAEQSLCGASRCCTVANALIQKFEVRGGDDALRSRLPNEGLREGLLFADPARPFPAAALPLKPSKVGRSYLHDTRPTTDRSRYLCSHRLLRAQSDTHGLCWHASAVQRLVHLTSWATSPELVFT